MTKFEFSSKDLINHWGIKWFELIDYVRTSNGKLQPYNSYGYRIIDPCTDYGDSVFRELFPLTLAERPDLIESVSQKTPPKHVLHEKNQPEYWGLNLKAHAYYQLIEVVFRAHNCVIGDFTVPADEIEAETLILNAKGWLFKTDDVSAFEKKHGLDRSEKHTSSDLPELISKVEQKTIKQDKAVDKKDIPTIVFYKDGDLWKIGKKGAEKTFNHLKGFEYISFLIRHKNESFKPLEVFHLGNVPDEDKFLNKVDFHKIGNSSELTKHIKYLEKKLTTETDQEERDEMAYKISVLRKIKNEGFKAFKQKSDSCRTNVYNVIKTAAQKIEKELPALYKKKYFNFGKSEVIKTGNELSYQQFNFGLSVNWIL